jgi:hypothetical protein
LSLVTVAQHPSIRASEALVEKALAYRLLAHLSFTTVLELESVNPVCSELGRGESRVALTDQQKEDALRIYCDEGGHALFVELLASSVEAAYGVERGILGEPLFNRRLRDRIAENRGRIGESVIRHFFVSVSETLVTRILKDIPHDPTVSSTVRQVIGDHATDEACHSLYFRWYFPELWDSLRPEEKRVMGRLLADFIWFFLAPDRALDKRIVAKLGFTEPSADRLIAEVYDERAVAAAVREAARPTLWMFRAAGVFDLPETEDLFAQRALLA